MIHRWLMVLLVVVAVAGCAAPAGAPQDEQPTAAIGAPAKPVLTVMTHDSFSISEAALASFQEQCGCEVKFLKSGDAGLALNKAILSKASPLADVFYGVDNTFLSRALREDIFEPYASPALAGIADDLKLDPSGRLLPVDLGYVSVNYDKAYFTEKNLPPPDSLRALTDPRYKGMLVVENPASSSPGMAFLLTTVAVFGEEGDYTYLDYWRDLRENDVLVPEGWEDAYYGQFSGSSGDGERPLVVSYATSPAAEVYFADPQPIDAPTGNVAPPGETFGQVEFAGILKGTEQTDLAQRWVDFMLSETFQTDIPLQMWVYPARDGTSLPEVFQKHAQQPERPVTLSPDAIDAGREKWLQAWTDAVLR